MVQSSFHESYLESGDVRIGTNRSFGIVFTVVFALIGLYPLWNGDAVHDWALSVAAALLVVSLFLPRLLAPFNLLWFKFGLLLHKIVSPLVMALIFFGCMLPISLLMRLFGKRPLDLAFQPEAKSYWIHRQAPAPEPDSMKRQF